MFPGRSVEASDPKALAAWLEGRDGPSRDQIGSFRASGDVAFGAERIAIERFKALERRLAFSFQRIIQLAQMCSSKRLRAAHAIRASLFSLKPLSSSLQAEAMFSSSR